MGYSTIAEASSPEALTPQVGTYEYVDGQRGRVILNGPGLGPLGDLALAEQIWGQQLVPVGAQLVDVWGEGLNTAIVEFIIPRTAGANQSCGCAGSEQYAQARFPVLAVAIVGAIIGALALIGWITNNIRLTAQDTSGSLSTGVWIALIAGGVIVAASALGGGSRRTRSP
jgi:hypothetical protein